MWIDVMSCDVMWCNYHKCHNMWFNMTQCVAKFKCDKIKQKCKVNVTIHRIQKICYFSWTIHDAEWLNMTKYDQIWPNVMQIMS